MKDFLPDDILECPFAELAEGSKFIWNKQPFIKTGEKTALGQEGEVAFNPRRKVLQLIWRGRD